MTDIYLETLRTYLKGSEWRQSIEMFVDSNCKYFHNIAEMDHQQFQLWKSFQEIVEAILEAALSNIGGSIDQLEKGLDEVMNGPSRGPKDDLVKDVLDSLLSFTDFESFAKMMKSASDVRQDKGDKTNIDSLLRMGFPIAAIEEVLDKSDPDASLEDLVTMLSGFLSNGQFDTNQPTRETALVIDPHSTSNKGTNFAMLKFVDEAGVDGIDIDINELNAKFVIAESVLDTFDSSVRAELPLAESTALSLIRWAEDMKVLYHDIVTAYNEQLPCKSMCFSCDEGLIQWYKDLEETRIRIDEGSTNGSLVSDNELRRMAELDRIAAMGTADEQLLHNLISRHDEVTREIQNLHRQCGFLAASDRGVKRENLEELYLYLKQQVASGIDLDEIQDELHDQVYSVVSSAKGAEVINLLLDMHLFEDEHAMLRVKINGIVGSPSHQNRQSKAGGGSGSSGGGEDCGGAKSGWEWAAAAGGGSADSGAELLFDDVVVGGVPVSSASLNAESKLQHQQQHAGGDSVAAAVGAMHKGDGGGDSCGAPTLADFGAGIGTALAAGTMVSSFAADSKHSPRDDGAAAASARAPAGSDRKDVSFAEEAEEAEAAATAAAAARREARAKARVDDMREAHKSSLRQLKATIEAERERQVKVLHEKLMLRRALKKQAEDAATAEHAGAKAAEGEVGAAAVLAEHSAAVEEVELELVETNNKFDVMVESMISGLKKRCLGELAAARHTLKATNAAATAASSSDALGTAFSNGHINGSGSQGHGLADEKGGSSSGSGNDDIPILTEEQKKEIHLAAAAAMKERFQRDHLQLIESLEQERLRQRDRIIKAVAQRRRRKEQSHHLKGAAADAGAEGGAKGGSNGNNDEGGGGGGGGEEEEEGLSAQQLSEAENEAQLDIIKMNQDFDEQEARALAQSQERALLSLAAVHLDVSLLSHQPSAIAAGLRNANDSKLTGNVGEVEDEDEDGELSDGGEDDGGAKGSGGDDGVDVSSPEKRRQRRALRRGRRWLVNVVGLKDSYVQASAELQQRLRLRTAALDPNTSSLTTQHVIETGGGIAGGGNGGNNGSSGITRSVGVDRSFAEAAARVTQVVTNAFDKQVNEMEQLGRTNNLITSCASVRGGGGGHSSSSSSSNENGRVRSGIIEEFEKARQELEEQRRYAKIQSEKKLAERRQRHRDGVKQDAPDNDRKAAWETPDESSLTTSTINPQPDRNEERSSEDAPDSFAVLERQGQLLETVLGSFEEGVPMPSSDEAYRVAVVAAAVAEERQRRRSRELAAADSKHNGQGNTDQGEEQAAMQQLEAERIRQQHLDREKKLLEDLHADMLDKKKTLEDRLQRRRNDEARKKQQGNFGTVELEKHEEDLQNLEEGFHKVASMIKSMPIEDITKLDLQELMDLMGRAAKGEEVIFPRASASSSAKTPTNATLLRNLPPAAYGNGGLAFTITKESRSDADLSFDSSRFEAKVAPLNADSTIHSDVTSSNFGDSMFSSASSTLNKKPPLLHQKTDMAGEVKRISMQYNEEQQKHDLMMKIQQARQRQSLQRKLFEKSQAKQRRASGGGGGLGRAAGYGLDNSNSDIGVIASEGGDSLAPPKDDNGINIGPARFRSAEMYRQKSQQSMQPAFRGLPAEAYGAKAGPGGGGGGGSPTKENEQISLARRGLGLQHLQQRK